jgi:hypothetical protein
MISMTYHLLTCVAFRFLVLNQAPMPSLLHFLRLKLMHYTQQNMQ